MLNKTNYQNDRLMNILSEQIDDQDYVCRILIVYLLSYYNMYMYTLWKNCTSVHYHLKRCVFVVVLNPGLTISNKCLT